MTEHTPTPWTAASKYSSVVGVPIVNQQGKRVGNTAIPDMPPEWDHLKRQAEIDAAFIVKAVNNHDALVKALKDILDANYDFRNGMPEEWVGTPLQDACDNAVKIFAAVVGRART